jgi:uncharacterized protein (DUF1684 family)
MRIVAFAVAFLVALTACSSRVPDIPQLEAKAYEDTINAFHARRARIIAGPEGWATHVGLWWLEPGSNRIGSDSSAKVRLPANRSPRLLGEVIVDGDSARFVPARGVAVRTDSVPVTGPVRLRSDAEPNSTLLRTGSLVIGYITRNERKAVRIRDTLSEVRQNYATEFFPADTAFRVTARFVPRPTPDSMSIIDVYGIETRMSWPGELRFRLGGAEHALQVIKEPTYHGNQLFVMFKDSTSGKESYGAMRYIFVAAADSLGRTVLDFNQAFTPPCAFTNYSTCSLPPPGNTLPVRVTAGEKKPTGHQASGEHPRIK